MQQRATGEPPGLFPRPHLSFINSMVGLERSSGRPGAQPCGWFSPRPHGAAPGCWAGGGLSEALKNARRRLDSRKHLQLQPAHQKNSSCYHADGLLLSLPAGTGSLASNMAWQAACGPQAPSAAAAAGLPQTTAAAAPPTASAADESCAESHPRGPMRSLPIFATVRQAAHRRRLLPPCTRTLTCCLRSRRPRRRRRATQRRRCALRWAPRQACTCQQHLTWRPLTVTFRPAHALPAVSASTEAARAERVGGREDSGESGCLSAAPKALPMPPASC